MVRLSRCIQLLAIVLLWAATAVADPVPVQESDLDAETVVWSQGTTVTRSAYNRGDLNLDGISYSIVDWVMTSAFSCIMDPGPWPPLDVQVQGDTDCSGEVTIGDLSRHYTVLMGEHEPYTCPDDTPVEPGYEKSAKSKSTSASDAYVIEIQDVSVPGVDSGWIEVVLLEAPEIMTGFQLNIEYDSDRLEFVDGEVGDHLAPGLYKSETVTEPGMSSLRIAGVHCPPSQNCPGILTLPELPATLARLKFRVRTTDEDFVTDLNFAWDYCFDNGISVGPEEDMCGLWPHYLAVSQEVYNSAGDNITGLDIRYGGAGEECMVGGTRDVPERQIDFHSGTLSYQQSCCEGNRGDPNGNGDEEPTIGDISVMIDAKFISGNCDLICIPEADINGSGGVDPTCDDITIGDISLLIDCLFISGDLLPCYQPCP